MNHLMRFAITFNKIRVKNPVPLHNGIQCVLKTFDMEWSFKLESEWYVVEVAVGMELVHVPEPFFSR